MMNYKIEHSSEITSESCHHDDTHDALACGLIYAGVLYPEENIQDNQKAVHYLKQAAFAGEKNALHYLMHAYLSGCIAGSCCAIEPDYDEWLAFCNELAEHDNQQVAYSAALWFSGFENPGEAVSDKITSCFKVDKEKAIYFFKLASRGNDESYANAALSHLCHMLAKGCSEIGPDLARLRSLLEQLIANDNKYASQYYQQYFG
jgi:TPR repeat protein